MKLSHVTDSGEARMVDISKKPVVHREAVASGKVFLQPETIEQIKKNQIQKGDVLAVAKIAGIQGGKKTSELIPLCHNIPINKIDVDFSIQEDGITIKATAVCDGKTGIEMEALLTVAIAALSIYDMCKAVDKKMKISELVLTKKSKS
ncbi:MAG: cyclic pyranopterin monophosphate synthase MoaC [Candidatus Aminicenantes bacterium]|jgi:cyclic pyranopterin phosphate synthase